MNKLIITIVAILMFTTVAIAGDGDKVSYYQYTPNPNSVQVPGTIWNPILTETKDGKKVSKSYFQYNPTPVQPAGSVWNPLVTEKKNK